jgi:hypothetical protein
MGLHGDCGERFMCVRVEHLKNARAPQQGFDGLVVTAPPKRQLQSHGQCLRAKPSVPTVAPGHAEVSMLQAAGV